MAPPTTIRKAIGALKDQITIRLAKASRKLAPELDVAIVKATSHDNSPPDEKHIRSILILSSYSPGYAKACVATISRRLAKTRNWIVALKSLMLLHRLLIEGHPSFHQELLHRLQNMHDAHFSSRDHSAFIRAYAFYLAKSRPVEMKREKVLERMNELQQLLGCFLACRPIGLARSSRLILAALCQIVRESFQIYQDIGEVLDYACCVRFYEACASIVKQIDELAVFYAWFKDTGVGGSMEYPDLQRLTAKVLETMEEFMKEGGRLRRSSPDDVALPKTEKSPQADLVDLSDDAVKADSQGNKPALDFFSTGGAANGIWEAFPSADWELALVDTARNSMYDQAMRKDPFAASLSIPPASYEQMADFGRKQQPLLQERQMWQQCASHGMPSQDSLIVLNNAYYYGNSAVPYGMQTNAGYYYPHM